jgi:hypothetical protein
MSRDFDTIQLREGWKLVRRIEDITRVNRLSFDDSATRHWLLRKGVLRWWKGVLLHDVNRMGAILRELLLLLWRLRGGVLELCYV